MPIECSPVEYVTIPPPSGQTCAQYLDNYISFAGGYITNPDATSACQYCSFSSTDAFLETSFNIFYSHHWRDLGIFVAFVIFNVSGPFHCPRAHVGGEADNRAQTTCIYMFTYLFRVRTGSLFGSLKDRVAALRSKSS